MSSSEYLPAASYGEYSDDNSESGNSELDDRDEALLDVVQPVEEQGWHLMSDPFSDAKPDPIA